MVRRLTEYQRSCIKHAALVVIFLVNRALAVTCTQTDIPMVSKAQNQKNAFDLANMDPAFSPGDDFYEYACGGWIKSHPVQMDKSKCDNFESLDDANYERLGAMINEAANNTTKKNGCSLQKIVDFYRTGMDIITIEKQSIDPIEMEFSLIDNISSPADIQAVSTHLMELGIDPLFHFYADVDEKKSRIMIAILAQGGIGLPDRDYYLRHDDDSAKIIAQYLNHVTNMFILLGYSPENAMKNARTIIRMETRLANASFTNVDGRNVKKTYNKMSLDELKTFAPGIDWTQFILALKRPDITEINIKEPSFIKELSIMIHSENVDDWKIFLRWKLISAMGSYLGAQFENESFDFNDRKLKGQKQMEPRWKRVIKRMNRGLGEAIGRIYVEKYFDSESKVRMEDLVDNLKRALRCRIQNLTWMNDSTKAMALDKLGAMEIKVGYPSEWRDYFGLVIKKDSYIGNTLRTWNFEFYHGNNGIDKIGTPVNRNIWDWWPHEVNAGYNPQKNVLFFPAGILQPPFFSKEADDAINYGAIGMVIGHEMTHGFDDQGRKYDKDGNLTDWWTEHDEENFNKSTHILIDEYNKFEVLPGLHINGNLTLGENIADFGGLIVAYDAYKLSQKKEPEKIDAFTGDQRFFLGFAQMLRQSITDEMLRTRVLTNVHSPSRFRVNGVVYNIPEFYRAFSSVKPQDKMYRSEKERPVIW